MRKAIFASWVVATACAGSGSGADSAVAGDSAVVAGAPAVPTTVVVTGDSGTLPVGAPAKKPLGAVNPGAAATTKAPAAPSTPGVATSDSVVGIVAVTGTSFDRHVMIAGPGSRTEIIGSLTSLIGHVAGTEVSVTGKRTGSQLDAKGFLVRSVDGQPAIDGRLKTEGGAQYIVSAAGAKTRIANSPPSFQGRDGDRVWITGDPSKGIAAFGFIDPPR